MRKVIITQTDVDGRGSDRVTTLWVKASEVESFIRRKSRAYNMDRTTIVMG